MRKLEPELYISWRFQVIFIAVNFVIKPYEKYTTVQTDFCQEQKTTKKIVDNCLFFCVMIISKLNPVSKKNSFHRVGRNKIKHIMKL